MKLNNNNAGLEAESVAATFLMNQGLSLVARNYHCKFGEIDIIMKDAKSLVFIEVRLRTNPRFGDAAMSITAKKQQKIIHTAQYFLQENAQQYANTACRFDAILMNNINYQELTWIRDAFAA